MRIEEINKSYINGEWVDGESGNLYEIRDPYDDSVVTSVNLATAGRLEDAFQIAEKAQKGWAQSSVEERRRVLQGAYDYLNANRDDIVQLMNWLRSSTIFEANLEIDL